MIDPIFDWLVANQIIVWLLIALACLLFEMGSPGLFFFLSFFFGALMAAASTFVTTSLLWQSIVFVVGTALSFAILHYWVKSRRLDTHIQTNIYALKKKHGIVISRIAPEKMGRVKIGGEIWSARPARGQTIEKDTIVTVVRVKGAHVVVQELIEEKK